MDDVVKNLLTEFDALKSAIEFNPNHPRKGWLSDILAATEAKDAGKLRELAGIEIRRKERISYAINACRHLAAYFEGDESSPEYKSAIERAETLKKTYAAVQAAYDNRELHVRREVPETSVKPHDPDWDWMGFPD